MGNNSFRVKYITKDGILLRSRKGDRDLYALIWPGRPVEREFVDYVVITECRELGVRELSRDHTNDELVVTVDWISKKSR